MPSRTSSLQYGFRHGIFPGQTISKILYFAFQAKWGSQPSKRPYDKFRSCLILLRTDSAQRRAVHWVQNKARSVGGLNNSCSIHLYGLLWVQYATQKLGLRSGKLSRLTYDSAENRQLRKSDSRWEQPDTHTIVIRTQLLWSFKRLAGRS